MPYGYGAKTGPTDSNNALQRTTAHTPSCASLEWRLPLNANVGQLGSSRSATTDQDVLLAM